ncbi:MAG: 5-(carboxyamino)imidazole ribonucleotide synthase [Bacteroidetes bacterium]|nr:5-(carboxyamino)imidazole ribonucleotide synthase [Bacteroidota bacterium]
MHYFSSNFKLGILGGGQLGKMLLYPCRKWDIQTLVLDPSEVAPARLAAHEFHRGDLLDFDTVYNFGKQVHVLTIEIEHVNIEALLKLQREGVKVYPQPEALQTIGNKSIQKDHYAAHGIPTAPYQNFDSTSAAKAQTSSFPVVWKSAQGGYDGKGVKIIKSLADFDELPDVPCLVEAQIEFEKELAVIVASSTTGERMSYPVVAMDFHPEANQVEYVICPANITDQIAEEARTLAEKVAESLGVTGLLAVELFLGKDNKLYVNEVAPRPHNSGHYSLEASYTDQYEQHVRAILGLPLGNTESKVAAVMVNLVGDENHTGPVYYKGLEEAMKLKGVCPHIYGKSETKPFRKMGHITVVDSNPEEAYLRAREVKDLIKVISNE